MRKLPYEYGIRGYYYKRRPLRGKSRTSKENHDAVGPRQVALPDGVEDFDWTPGPIENDGTGTVKNRSGGVRVVKIPEWDK